MEKKFDPIAQFNSGKGFKTAPQGGMDEGVFPFYIQGVELELSKYKDRQNNDQYQLKIICCVDDPKGEISDKDLFTMVYQTIKFTPNGEMKNPAYPAFQLKNGEEIPASQLYELLGACKEYDQEAYDKAKTASLSKTGTIDWIKFLKGLKFNYEARVGDRKDGTGKYVILLTPKQKKKDEEYQNKSNSPEMGSEADFERATSPAPEVNTQTSMADKDGIIRPEDLPF